jgi:cyclase
MLKTRVIPVMLWKEGGLVKGKGFDHSRNVGSVFPSVKVYNARDVDELVLVDVTASTSQHEPRYEEISRYARECNVPLTVGGGIQSAEHIEKVLRAGADKVLINSACYSDPRLVEKSSKHFGNQCIVVGIDYKILNDVPVCFSHAGSVRQSLDAVTWAKELESLGAGEILLTNCSRDGFMSGYDVETIAQVARETSVPVIAGGGAGHLDHFVDVLKRGGANAVAAGSVFHFTEITPRAIKERLALEGIPVRIGFSP